MSSYTLGSMFAGIGGMELGFEATGQIETKWQVEIDGYANKVLKQHWPSVARWRDVRTFPPRPVKDWKVDIIAGGFPCQDVSTANGNARGLDGERSGLFAEIVRVAGIIRPRAIVLENVAALYFRGLDRVLGALAEIGYDAEWHCVSADSVGAPHRRDRVFIVGYQSNSNNGLPSETPLVDTIGAQCERGRVSGRISAEHPNIDRTSDIESGKGKEATRHIKPRVGGVANGFPQWMDEPEIPRIATGIPKRADRLRCLGNAIVPQVAEVVAWRLLEILEGNGVTDDTKQKAIS